MFSTATRSSVRAMVRHTPCTVGDGLGEGVRHTIQPTLTNAIKGMNLCLNLKSAATTTQAAIQPRCFSVASFSSRRQQSHESDRSNHAIWWMIGSSMVLVAGETTRRWRASNESIVSAAAAVEDKKPEKEEDESDFNPFTDPVYNPPPLGRHDEWISNWDGLDGVPVHIGPKSGRPIHVTRHLIFIRHGQYVLPTKDTEHLDPVLTELGREQARITGRRLKELGYPISVIHCSTMARAKETAELIRESFPDIPLQPHHDLREGVPCVHVPKHPTWKPTKADYEKEAHRIQAGFKHIVKRWRTDSEGKQIHSFEEWKKIQEKQEIEEGKNQLTESISTEVSLTPSNHTTSIIPSSSSSPSVTLPPSSSTDASSSAGTISLATTTAATTSANDTTPTTVNKSPIRVDRYELVVCHGNVIRYSLLRALQLPPQAWLRIAIYNTGMTHIYISWNGHVQLRQLGDTGHLTKEQITYH